MRSTRKPEGVRQGLIRSIRCARAGGVRNLQEERKWSWLMDQLRPGMEADESKFIPLDPQEIIKAAKKEKAGNGS